MLSKSSNTLGEVMDSSMSLAAHTIPRAMAGREDRENNEATPELLRRPGLGAAYLQVYSISLVWPLTS